jgi:hypothetical protein
MPAAKRALSIERDMENGSGLAVIEWTMPGLEVDQDNPLTSLVFHVLETQPLGESGFDHRDNPRRSIAVHRIEVHSIGADCQPDFD